MASTGPNPLELLREYTMQNKSVEFLDSEGNLTRDLLRAATVRFGEDASFPRDTPTSYSRGNNEADQYTLSALLHFLDHRDQSFYEYMKTTNTMGLQTVSFGDRISLLDYLTGKSASAGQGSGPQAGEKHGNTDADGPGEISDSSRRTRMRTAAAEGVGAATSAGDIARDIMRRERLVVTTSTALSSNKSFSRVPEMIKDLFPSKHGAGSQAAKGAAGKPSSGAAAGASGSSHRRMGHRKRRDPIIVVPAATTAMLNMYNIRSLLKDHQFVDSRDMMEKGGSKPREVIIEHTMSNGGPSLRFRVVDSVLDFTEADWNSLVCVFTQGAAWQFKNWTWSTPEEVFQNCLGYYPKYHDERPKDTTRSWGISMLNIERSKRHTDRATVVGLWNSIEQYIQRRKPDFLE
ncbi:CDC73-domain-containing protein [Martensiomyces pterosporus]|nr:CDC73-domain-containing protein [Martensiomyces pterosporus]